MVSSAPVDFKEEFESRVLGIGRVLSLMTPWDDPRNLKRIWCIFEIFTALSSECSFSVVLPGREKSRMSKMVLSGAHGVEALFRALARIDIETAEASVQEDKENILKIIADQPNGFHAVNSTVRERLRGWIRKVLYSFVDKRSKEAKEISPDKDGLSSEPFDSFCRKVSDVLERIGDLEAALDLRRRAEEKQLSNLKNDVLSSATASSHKGRALAAEGHIDEALDVLYQALSVQDPKQYETTKTCFEIGLLLHTTGRNVQALGVLKQCLVSQQVFADAKRDTAITESKIGAICGELGYAKEALNRTRKALLALETDGGPNHPDTAACRVILASFLPNENDALNMLSQGQSAQESILGLKHPDLANTYRRKGDVLRRMNNLVEAEIFYKKAIEIYENGNIVAMNLDAFAMVCASLSLIAFCRKDRGLAASYHSKAVGFLQTASCTSEIILKVNAIYDFYGEALFQQECPEISLALYQQSENHDRILDIALNYANQSIRAFSDKQTRLEALALKSKAFSAIKDCPLDSKQQLIALYVDTGNKECENENGDGALGLLLLQQGATAIKELLGKGELELATCYDTMALALSKNGNIMGALKYFEKSIGALEAFGTHVQNWRIYVTQARIAECKNDPQTALKFYEKTVSALKSAGAQEGDRRLAEGWSRIEALAKQLGDL